MMPPMLHAMIYTLAALVLLSWGGNAACRQLFRMTGLSATEAPTEGETTSAEDGKARAGRVIGTLERLILAIGILTQSWNVMAAVIALKTVGRFKELDDKTFAEYFLVGSLFSLLWAGLVACGWLIYDETLGLDLHARLMDLLGPATGG